MEIRNVKGTYDLYGNDANQYSYVESLMVAIATIFAFNEIRLPVIEHSELFVRSVGDGSDVVRKEMYTFLDKGNRSITLRPEFTAGIIRSFVQNKLYANADYPVKYFYCGPVFRYDRPQLGRYRQFNQFGVESLCSTSISADVEVITLAYTILSSLGLDGVKIKINSIGDEETRENYKKALKEYFSKYIDNMCEDCKCRYEINPLRILDCKVPEDQEIVKGAPKISSYYSSASKERLEKVLFELDSLEIPYEIDDSLVRGLDYYSEVVFEFHYVSKSGKDYGALGGGGHYDKLIAELGGPSLPGVGFSFGIERVVSVLKDDGLFGEEEMGTYCYVMPMGESVHEYALNVTQTLRLGGLRTEMCYEQAKFSTMFKRALRKNAKYAVIIGEEEMKNNTVQIKDLSTQNQECVKVDEIIKYFDEHAPREYKEEE